MSSGKGKRKITLDPRTKLALLLMVSLMQAGTDYGAHGSVHARSITTARQYANRFDLLFHTRVSLQFVSSFTQWYHSVLRFNAVQSTSFALNHYNTNALFWKQPSRRICVKIRARKCHFVAMLSVPTSLSSSLNSSGWPDAYRWRGTRRYCLVSVRYRSTGMSPSKMPSRLTTFAYSLLLREGTRIYSFFAAVFIGSGLPLSSRAGS